MIHCLSFTLKSYNSILCFENDNVESLKASLRREWAKIPQKTLRTAVEAFPRRLKNLIQKKGGYIE